MLQPAVAGLNNENTRREMRRGVLAPVRLRDTPLYRDPYRIALFALIFVSITHIEQYIGIGALRPGVLLFVAALLFALMRPADSIRGEGLKHFLARVVFFQAILACASALFGISLGHSATFIINTYWKTVVFALLLMTSFRGPKDVRRMMWAVAASGVALAFLSLFVVHLSGEQGAKTWDANDVGLIMVTTLPLLLLLLQTSTIPGRAVALVGIALLAVTITQSDSRGAFVGAAVVGLLLLIFLPGVSVIKRVAAIAGIIAAMLIWAPPQYWQRMRSLEDPQSDYNWNSLTGRRHVAERGFGYMLQYPIFGLGVNNFAFAEGTISSLAEQFGGTRQGFKLSAPHNSWVEAAAETGIPGFVAWVALVVGSALSLLRLRRRLPRDWVTHARADQRFMYLATLYLPIAIVGFAVCATFVSWAWNDLTYLLPALVVGVHMSFGRYTAANGPAPARPQRRGYPRVARQATR